MAKFQISNFKLQSSCALGREKNFAGLRQIFRCLVRHFRLCYRYCKCTKLSLLPTNTPHVYFYFSNDFFRVDRVSYPEKR